MKQQNILANLFDCYNQAAQETDSSKDYPNIVAVGRGSRSTSDYWSMDHRQSYRYRAGVRRSNASAFHGGDGLVEFAGEVRSKSKLGGPGPPSRSKNLLTLVERESSDDGTGRVVQLDYLTVQAMLPDQHTACFVQRCV